MTDEARYENLLVDELAAYQEALEAGGTTADRETVDEALPPQLKQRIAERKRCLAILHALGGHQPLAAAPSDGKVPRWSDWCDSPSTSRFQRLEQLGSGGFGIVWKARDPVTGRIVALKVPRPEVLATDELRKRFEHEAQAAARLDHPNIVAVLEAGSDGPVPYIASTYYDAPTLAVWLREHPGGVDPKLAAQTVLALAGALAHAHERGVLHRDVKPGNVLLVPSNTGGGLSLQPKLMDFGLAKLAEGQASQLTRSGTLLGTLQYMSPEQAAGRTSEITSASDIYGLGAVLYEMLTGWPPFCGASDWETLRHVIEDDPPSVESLRAGTSRDLVVICNKCLHKEPTRRYRSARELAEDLDRYLTGRPIHAKPATAWERLVKWSRRNPQWATLMAVVLLAVIGGLVFLTYSNIRIARALDAERVSREQLSKQLYSADIRRAGEAVEHNDPVQARELLSRYLPAAGENDSREFAWHYLWNSLDNHRQVLPPHLADVYSLSLSVDGRTLATGCRDGKARLWRMPAGELMRELTVDGSEVNEVEISPDGKWLATACESGRVAIWNADTGDKVRQFEIGGIVVTDFEGREDDCLSLTADASGLILATGFSGHVKKRSRGKHGALLRFRPNGTRQSDFASGGYGPDTSLKLKDDRFDAVLPCDDGTLLLVGTHRTSGTADICLLRSNPDGSLDTTFGQQGLVSTDLQGGDESVHAAIRQVDGKVLVAGVTQLADHRNAMLVRYQADGSLDSSFGTGGTVRIAAEAIHSIALASDGKPVLAACIRDKAGGVTNGCLVRLNADGSLDSSFAEQGMFLLASERITSDLKALAVQGDDKIVAAGFTGENNDDDQRQLVVLRLLADGRLDLDFGEAGRVRAALDGGFLPQSLALQPDGKIVVAGGAHLKNRSSFALARLETNGALDKSFGNGGRVILPLGAGESVIRSIVLQDDGKIVAGGYVLDASNDDESKNFALARFNVDGSLDRTYSSNGAQGVEFSPNSTRLYVYAEQCLEAWDVLSGERIARTFTPKSDIKTLRASSDGKWLAAATDGRGYVWDATDVYAHPRVLSESKGGVHQVDFAAASETAVVVRHGGAGELIAFNSDEKATELGPLLEGGPPRILKMSPDGRLMAVGGGNAINLFRTADWKPAGRIINGHGRIFDAVFIPDGLALVTADVHGDVVAWQISDDGPPLSPIGGREPWLARDDITTLALAPDGLLAACGDSSGNIAVVALASGEAVYVHRPREVPVRGLSFVDGAAKLLTAYADGQIQTVDIRLGQVVGRWSCGRPIQAVAKAPQGDRLAIAYGDLLQIAVIDWPSGKERWRIPALPGSKVLAFSPGGQELVIACGATMSVHNASSGVNLAMAGNLGEEFVDVHVFADGKHMLVAEGTRGLTLRSFPDCRVLARVLDHADGVKAVAVTPDGRNFATADHEDQLRILDARTMQPLLVLKGAEKSGSLSPLQFSVNGDKLVGAWGKRIVVWSAGKR